MTNDVGSVWLSGRAGGAYIGYSVDWVEARATEWQLEHVPFQIRFRKNKKTGDREYYLSDIVWFLKKPVNRE